MWGWEGGEDTHVYTHYTCGLVSAGVGLGVGSSWNFSVVYTLYTQSKVHCGIRDFLYFLVYSIHMQTLLRDMGEGIN